MLIKYFYLKHRNHKIPTVSNASSPCLNGTYVLIVVNVSIRVGFSESLVRLAILLTPILGRSLGSVDKAGLQVVPMAYKTLFGAGISSSSFDIGGHR